MNNKLNVTKAYVVVSKAEPLYTVVNNENDDTVFVDLMDQGGFIQIKMTSEGVIVDVWCQRGDGSESCIDTMAVTYEELRGEE